MVSTSHHHYFEKGKGSSLISEKTASLGGAMKERGVPARSSSERVKKLVCGRWPTLKNSIGGGKGNGLTQCRNQKKKKESCCANGWYDRKGKRGGN